MHPSLQPKFDRLESRLIRLRQMLQPYAHEALIRQPASGGWSALQVVQHLALVEHLSGEYLKKKIARPDGLQKAGFRSKLRMWLLKLSLVMPLKFKAPAMVGETNFRNDLTLEAAFNHWLTVRHDLKTLLEQVPPHLLHHELYKHPMAGRLSLPGMLDFLAGHFDRHERQILRSIQ